MDQNRAIILLLSLLLMISGVLYWFFVGNKSQLIVEAKAPYTVTAERYRFFECRSEPCEMDIPFGERQFCLKKAGFLPLCETLVLPWREETIWQPNLTKEPTIVTPKNPASSSVQPEALDGKTPYTTTLNGKKYLYEEQSKSVFRIDRDQKRALITTFTGLQNPSLVAAGKNLLLATTTELYYIDTENNRKHLAFTADSLAVQSLHNGIVGVAADQKLYLFQQKNLQLTPLPFVTDLDHVVSCQPAELYYAEEQKGGEWYFSRFSLESEQSNSIVSAKIDLSQKFRLFCTEKENEIGIKVEGNPDRILKF